MIPCLGRQTLVGVARVCSSFAIAACATAGSTYQSGVGDKMIEHPPYYAGASVANLSMRYGHLPITYQQGAVNPPNFDPSAKEGLPVSLLLEEMNAYLDSLGVTTRIQPAAEAPGTPIDVYFGCPRSGMMDCEERDNSSALGRTRTHMSLLVRRPSADWAGWMSNAAQAAGVPATLVITLEVSDYLTKQRGILGTKEVELGTGYTVKLPWLTSVETPVGVLQLTGALVGSDGKAIRIGAEGILARRTALVASAINAQRMIVDKDVNDVRTAERDDLEGNPLVWKVALRNLVAQLTGRPDIAR
jgi:hypothetical protein